MSTGSAYNGNPGEDINDLYPDVLWKYLKLYIKQQGLPLIMDLEAGSQVWNFPVYAYRISYEPTGGDNYKGLISLYFASDEVFPDYVGVLTNKRDYPFTCKMRNGSVVLGSGRWLGKDHPDFAWYPVKQQAENPNLDYQTVLKMLGRNGSGPVAPPPPPLTDPNNPPQPPGVVPDPPVPPLPPDVPGIRPRRCCRN